MRQSRHVGTRSVAVVATVVALTIGLAACGGTKKGETGSDIKTAKEILGKPETRLADAGDPQRGGKLVYGVEADSTGGFCLPEAQLAISGMLVVRAVYDTLTVPNAEGDYVPYLAKKLDHSADYKTWTIDLRPNIKFHDGTKLDATVVKNNLDAYRGTYKGRSPLLFKFVLANIKDTKVTGPLQVTVSMTKPWIAFPAYLYSSSRMGIMAQSQLDDPKTCATKLVGTGPFKFVKYTPNQGLTTKANPDYWQIAPDGKPYPLADSLDFRFLPDSTVRNQSVESGDINIMHTTNTEDLSGDLKDQVDSGKLNMLVSEDGGEISFLQLNASKPPFNDINMRRALAMGADRSQINDDQNNGVPTVADGPFAPDSPAYLKDPGFPQYNLKEAKRLVKEYVRKGGKAEFNLTTTTDPSVKRLAQLIQQRAKQTGVTVKLILRDQAALINDAIGKQYQAMVFRNYPGGDPDINYVWWYGAKTNPVNFGGYDDPEINRLLDAGRSETDKAKRIEDYKDISREFAKQVYNIWSWYTPWGIVERSNVHNILGPPLPGPDASKKGSWTTTDKAREPSTGLATAHSLIGLWISK
jgi:peptide/nickel transport system substrate-binding protein